MLPDSIFIIISFEKKRVAAKTFAIGFWVTRAEHFIRVSLIYLFGTDVADRRRACVIGIPALYEIARSLVNDDRL